MTLDSYDSKKYPLCCPMLEVYGPDFKRFKREFISAASTVDCDADWALDDVTLGRDPGGDAPGAPLFPAGVAALAQAEAASRKRKKKAAGYLIKYVIDPTLRESLLNEHPGDGREMWLALLEQCDTPTDEMETATRKASINSATILHTVGFKEGALPQFARKLQTTNAEIEPPNDRVSEHDMAIKLLKSIAEATQHFKVACLEEIKAAPANRRFTIGANGQRSLPAVLSHFGGLWDELIKSGSIPRRAPGGGGGGQGSVIQHASMASRCMKRTLIGEACSSHCQAPFTKHLKQLQEQRP